MEIVLWIIFAILIVIAFLGCFISKFPGPILAFVAILMAKLFIKTAALVSWWNVILIGLLVAASVVITRQIPKWSAKLGEYHKSGKMGALIGSIIVLIFVFIIFNSCKSPVLALILTILCMIAFPFGMAFLMEYTGQKENKDTNRALISACSVTVSYVGTTILKLFIVFMSVYMMFNNNGEPSKSQVERASEGAASVAGDAVRAAGAAAAAGNSDFSW